MKEVLEKIDEYCTKYRKDGLPQYEFSELYDLFPNLTDENTHRAKHQWPGSWPVPQNNTNAGVYLVFNKELKLVYVGKASMNSSIQARLNAHFKESPGDKSCELVGNWSNPKYFICVFMPEGHSFEAPALEEYLIKSLNPVDNTVGVG